ncbi:MAG: hypothetical protein ACERKZ_18840 [Lachnotalea sp.]
MNESIILPNYDMIASVAFGYKANLETVSMVSKTDNVTYLM